MTPTNPLISAKSDMIHFTTQRARLTSKHEIKCMGSAFITIYVLKQSSVKGILVCCTYPSNTPISKTQILIKKRVILQ